MNGTKTHPGPVRCGASCIHLLGMKINWIFNSAVLRPSVVFLLELSRQKRDLPTLLVQDQPFFFLLFSTTRSNSSCLNLKLNQRSKATGYGVLIDANWPQSDQKETQHDREVTQHSCSDTHTMTRDTQLAKRHIILPYTDHTDTQPD